MRTTAATTTHSARAPWYTHRWWGLFVIALAQLMIVLDATIVTVALPSIEHGLDVSPADRQWVITAYTLAFGGLLLLGGRLADYVGRKRLFVIGLLGFAASSLLGGASINLGMLLTARAIQGGFGALLAPSALSLLTIMFRDPRERGTAFAVFGAVAGGGSGVGLTLGGVLTQHLSWHWVFYVNVPIAIIAAAGGMFLLVDTGRLRRVRFDFAGATTATAGLVALVYGFSEAVTRGWDAPMTLGLVGGGLALLALFVGIQSRVAQPMLPLWLLANRGRGAAFLTVGLAMVGLFGAFLFLPLYLQIILGYSAVKTGVALLPVTGGVLISSILVNKLVQRIPLRALLGTGLLAAAVAMGWLTRMGIDTGYATHILPSLIVIGLGLGLVFPIASNLATFQIAPDETGVASATLNTSRQVGSSLGIGLLNSIAARSTAGYLAAHHGAPAHALGLVHGYTVALAWGAVVLAVAGIGALFLTKARLDSPRPQGLRTGPNAKPATAASIGTLPPTEPAKR